MNMTSEDDLAAVRDLRAGVAEPSDLAVVRTRRRVMSTLDGAARPARRRPLYAAVASGAAALAIVVGLVTAIQLTRGGGAPVPVQPGAAPTVEPSTPTAAATAPVPASTEPATPWVVPAGSVVYVQRSTGSTYRHEMWLDPQGAIVLQIARFDNGVQTIAVTTAAADVADERELLAAEGPSLNRPTPAYLNALPTDPAVLYPILRAQLAQGGDHLFKNSVQLLGNVEPLLSPPVRAAILAALALEPGSTVDHSPRMFAGHSVYTVQTGEGVNVIGLYVDTATGRIVGELAGLGSDAFSYAIVSTLGQRP
jgi:hypothetical protein